MASLTDISLVAQVAVLGNRRAFDELVRRYQSPVRRFFLHQTLGDETLSDDLKTGHLPQGLYEYRDVPGALLFSDMAHAYRL